MMGRRGAVLLAAATAALGQLPAMWTCSEGWYNADDGCDCECGAWDPDCDRETSGRVTLYCNGDRAGAGSVCDPVSLACVSAGSEGTTTAEPEEAPIDALGGSFDVMAAENLAAHKTEKFYTTTGFEPTDVMVLRRGARFSVRAPEEWGSDVVPSVTIGGAALAVTLSQAEGGRTWEAEIPGTFRVGRWELEIAGAAHGTVTVLFNPYASTDGQTHMPDAEDVAEYVENEYGRYWYGDVFRASLSRGAGSSGWAFAQYDVLNYVVELLEKLPVGDRGDARLVARGMTWLLNNAGNGQGVLHGRWDGEYDDGTAPGVWTGSRAILKQWSESGQQPVRYGQCWVFACLLTTVLRSLGIASRPVTNFRSAHERPPYDFLIDESTSDSIWNFHAWVDAWLVRDDVPEVAARGVQWNAVDATPQEESAGKYQMGPTALAVMRRNLNRDAAYDTAFVVSETNGIVVRNGQRIYDDVGRYISTKRRGCSWGRHWCREDITSEYKLFDSPLKTEEGEAGGARSGAALAKEQRLTSSGYDELAGFSLGADALEVGGDVVFYVRSHAGVALDGRAGGAEVQFTVTVVSYTGVPIGELALPAGAAGAMAGAANPDATVATVRIPEAAYRVHLGRANTLLVKAVVRNMVGMVVYEHNNKFELALPQPEVVSAESGFVTVKVQNPLAVPLTRGRVAYTAPAGDHLVKVGTIAPGQSETVKLAGQWCNREHMSKKIVISFTTAELGGMMHADADFTC